jgi:hypothetical protein
LTRADIEISFVRIRAGEPENTQPAFSREQLREIGRQVINEVADLALLGREAGEVAMREAVGRGVVEIMAHVSEASPPTVQHDEGGDGLG